MSLSLVLGMSNLRATCQSDSLDVVLLGISAAVALKEQLGFTNLLLAMFDFSFWKRLNGEVDL